MRDRRTYIIFGFIVWWAVWGALLTGFPFKNGQAVMYAPEQGMGPTPYVGLDIQECTKIQHNGFHFLHLWESTLTRTKGHHL